MIWPTRNDHKRNNLPFCATHRQHSSTTAQLYVLDIAPGRLLLKTVILAPVPCLFYATMYSRMKGAYGQRNSLVYLYCSRLSMQAYRAVSQHKQNSLGACEHGVTWCTGHTGYPIRIPWDKHNSRLLLFAWKMFISTDLTNIYVLGSISSGI